ncbi:hypothetical protein V1511DRAFT_489342 [Dipodascopsis uninucleata]
MQFKVPQKRLLTNDDLEVFLTSDTYTDIITFIEDLSNSVRGLKNSDPCMKSENICDQLTEFQGSSAVVKILDEIEQYVEQAPPVANEKSRFGNPAFRKFYDVVEKNYISLQQYLPATLSSAAAEEVGTYLLHSLGNRTRIDYGSGHELNFICYLLCLKKLGLLKREDYSCLVLVVFNRYISVMRTIQRQYWLEPAGSHGVWGLDDYHFLPFLFGASQLATHKYLRPRSIHDQDVLDAYSKDYMYLNSIAFINSVKTASLRWSSPMLDDISGVKTWEKVSSGMIKMYKAEVLRKLPIMQHFLFGSILPIGELPSDKMTENQIEEMTKHNGHVHGEGIWGDCCGIRLPSAIAARQASENNGELRSIPGLLKPLPFD